MPTGQTSHKGHACPPRWWVYALRPLRTTSKASLKFSSRHRDEKEIMPHINQGGGRIHAVLGALGLVLAVPAATSAQQVPAPDVSALAVPADIAASTDARISPLLLKAKGQVNVWVQMQTSPLAAAAAKAKESGLPLTRGAQRAHLSQIDYEHDELSRTAASLGGHGPGRVSKAHNPVAFSIPTASLSPLAAQPGGLTVRPVIDYQLHSSPETVPYIGATALHHLARPITRRRTYV